jgi:hypothetical protein
MSNEWFSLMSETIEREKERISNYVLKYPKGVTVEDVNKAENALGFALPEELKSLLMEFDGIREYAVKDDGKKIRAGSIIWGLADIVNWYFSWTIQNKTNLFCFGNSALGNTFGYLLVNGKPKEDEIWQSDHETEPPDEDIIKRATSLKEFITTSLADSRWY